MKTVSSKYAKNQKLIFLYFEEKCSAHDNMIPLTPWSRALLERSLVVWTLDSFPAVYGT
jgi:hypothetical protein